MEGSFLYHKIKICPSSFSSSLYIYTLPHIYFDSFSNLPPSVIEAVMLICYTEVLVVILSLIHSEMGEKVASNSYEESGITIGRCFDVRCSYISRGVNVRLQIVMSRDFRGEYCSYNMA